MKKLRKWLPGVLIFVVLLTSMLGGAAYAKYKTQLQVSGSLNITADLGTITVLESKANLNEDGSYTLNKNIPVTQNSYMLLPGLDIPKDPYVTVDVNAIPVFVFVEVVAALSNTAVTFKIDNTNWSRLEISGVPYKGPNGGEVYYYTGGTGLPKAVTEDLTIYILRDNQVTVGQELLHGTQSGLGLTFYAGMLQVVPDQSLELIYQNQIKKS